MPPYCPSRTLTVEKDGTGSGAVTSSPSGIACGAKCSAEFEKGTEVTLTATAAPGSTFVGWSGGGCSGTGSCVGTLHEDVTVTAIFDAIPVFTLDVEKDGAGAGVVTSSPSGIACGAKCSAEFEEGTEVTLTATAAPGSTFVGWSGGGCSGTGSCVGTLHEDVTVTAIFDVIFPSPPAGTLTIGPNASVEKGEASLEATCSGGPCEGTLELIAKTKKKKDVVIGEAPFDLPEGESATIAVKLSRAARKALHKRGRSLKVTVTGTGVTTSTVKLKLVKRKH